MARQGVQQAADIACRCRSPARGGRRSTMRRGMDRGQATAPLGPAWSASKRTGGSVSVSVATLRAARRRWRPRVRCCAGHRRSARPTSRISGSRKPRVVTAGLPRRMPLGFSGGFTSKGMAFLLTVMRARVERLLGFLAAHAFGEDINQHQVRIGAAGDDAESFVHERGGERLRIGHDLLLIVRRSRAAWLPGSILLWRQ